ncbi:MAG: NAD(P)H-binding protein [Propioniciclava sp.]
MTDPLSTAGHVLIVGGHGKIALLLAPMLVARGVTVTSVIRDPVHVTEVEAAGARAVVADVEAMSVADLAAMMGTVFDHTDVAGPDAVVWSAGAGGGNPARTYAVDRDAAIRTMDAADAADVRRFVMVSYYGSSTDHTIAPEDSFYAYAEAKAAADEHLRASGLNWTILGPSRLTLEAPTGLIEVGQGPTTVSRADVAAVVVATLADPQTTRRTIRFNQGSRPIAEVLVPPS